MNLPTIHNNAPDVDVILAFPGTGKTHYVNHHPNKNVMDLDINQYTSPKHKEQYVVDIIKEVGRGNIVLGTPRQDVRELLDKLDVRYAVVHPHPSLKTQYLERYTAMGKDSLFIDAMSHHWDDYIASCASAPVHLPIPMDITVTDVMKALQQQGVAFKVNIQWGE